MEFRIQEYSPSLREKWETLFINYAKGDLRDELPEGILREKICGLFLKNQEKGISHIALALKGGEPVGFAIYQIDSPESDWCKREGWGFIREFCIAPPYRRRGYGRILAGYAEERLRSKTNRLYLTAHDEGAAKFWAACGFTKTGEINKNGTCTMIK